MKKSRNLKHKIIFYVMSVSILVALLITTIMSFASISSTNDILLDNMQITARLASQNISSNLHLLTERMYNLSCEQIFSDSLVNIFEKQARIDEIELEIEFVWLSAYDLSGKKIYGDEEAPLSIYDTKYYSYLTKTENIVIGEPYYDNNILQLCVAAPLERDNNIEGYLVGSYKYDILNDVLGMLILGSSGNSYIINEDGVIIGDRNFQNIIDKKDIHSLYSTSENEKIYDKILNFQTGSALMNFNGINNYVGYAPIPGTNWALMINSPAIEFMGNVFLSILISILLAILLLVVSAFIIISVSKKISNSISSATNRLQKLADGNLTSEVILSDSVNESAVLTDALSKTIKSLNNYIRNIRKCLGSLSKGDYTIDIPDNFYGDFSSIYSSLCDITDSLNKTMLQMHHSSIEVNKNSMEVSDYAKQLYDTSSTQTELVEQLEKSIVSITSSIDKNKDNVIQIEMCSKDADEKTDLGSNSIQSMLNTMNEVNLAVNEISKISKIIKDISNQTNLLSLNASIEAVKAGEVGKGFQVVALEIGKLSQQIDSALKQTSSITEHSSKIIEKSFETANQTADSFKYIQEITQRYKEISENIADTVKEQTNAVDCVNNQLLSLKNIADKNYNLAEKTDKTAADSLEQSQHLRDYVSQVKIKEFV